MKIYLCHEKDVGYGLYVCALTRGRAKRIYASDVDCSMLDVHSQIMRRGVNEPFEGIMDDEQLDKYGLEYVEEDW